MRSKALLNVKYGVLSQMVKILLQFIVRKTFIYYLGVELLGVHSLFTSILSMLAMAELGIEIKTNPIDLMAWELVQLWRSACISL